MHLVISTPWVKQKINCILLLLLIFLSNDHKNSGTCCRNLTVKNSSYTLPQECCYITLWNIMKLSMADHVHVHWKECVCQKFIIHHAQQHSLLSYGSLRAKAAMLSARLSHRNSVRPSVRPSVRLSVRHTGGSGKNGSSYNHQIFTIGCLED